MHAVVIRVNVSDPESSEAELRERVVPRVSQAPGFVAGYWTRDGDSGLSMVVFEAEENARTAAEMIPNTIPDTVTLEGVEVREVVASA